jgi:hypothetical protein
MTVGMQDQSMHSNFRLLALFLPRSKSALILFSLITMGAVLHGTQASGFGLYWDSTMQFMQGMHAADNNVMKFILSDTFGYLLAERPFAYFLLMIQRAAFAVSLPALQWSIVGLLVLNAVVLARVASKIVHESWFVFVVGVIFLTCPLAPVQAIDPATSHYLWASLLALLAILLFFYGMGAAGRRQLPWFAIAAILYLASLLTHEVFALIPPTFVSLYLLGRDEQGNAGSQRPRRIYFHQPPAKCLGLFLIVLVVYGLWRVMVLPMYGHTIHGPSFYATSEIVLSPLTLAEKFLAGVDTMFTLWGPVLSQILAYPPALPYVFVSITFSITTWVITFRLMVHPFANRELSDGSSLKRLDGDHWGWAGVTGLALVIAALAVVAVSPGSIRAIFGASNISRINFVAAIGIALVLPPLLVLLVRLYQRSTTVSSLVTLSILIYIGFLRFPLGGNIFSHTSFFPTVFGRYSLGYALLVITYIAAVILVAFIGVSSYVPGIARIIRLRLGDRLRFAFPVIRAHVLSGMVACLVLIGSLFHVSVKKEFIMEWNQAKLMLKQLQSIAPSLEDHTFVVIIYKPPRKWFAPFTTHWELSSFMLALYDNWSIASNTARNLRFHLDGVESTYFRITGTWFPPGVKGPVLTHATLPLRGISYDRLLLFEFDGNRLHMLPRLEVRTHEGEHLVVQNNPERILARAPTRTAAWRHVTE